MRSILEGVGASPGRVLGPARRLEWEVPFVPHRTIEPSEADREAGRFEDARRTALDALRVLEARTSEALGPFEGKIFESQAWMVDDPDLVAGTLAYIRENHLSAERAFELQILEQRVRMLDSAHAMVLDRLPDLRDVRYRVLAALLALPDPESILSDAREQEILLSHDLTPSIAVRLDPERTLGFVTSLGSRGSHSVLLARALGIPAVVGVGARLDEVDDGTTLLIDGRTGRIVVGPSPTETESHRRAVTQATLRRERLRELSRHPTETTDGVHVTVQANLDQPTDADEARRLGAEGVGLFRSEFLVIGRREIPDEEEQYGAYRTVAEAFPDQEVTLRTFDIGGDKFPLFLSMPPEENPYLGWRAIRVCLDLPDLFRNQLKAAVRASAYGNIRILIPFVTNVSEIRRTKEILREVEASCDDGGRRIPLGIMVETPAALETLDLLAPYVEFVSLGTNDLTQYVLAADRGNAKLASIYDPLHPSLLRLYRRLEREAARHELDLSVCGELAADPVGAAVFVGLGYRRFSVGLSALPEIRETLRHVSAEELQRLCAGLGRCESGVEVRAILERYLERCGALTPPGSNGPDVGLSKA